jgi:hypothetical protein
MKQPGWAKDTEAQGFLREAQEPTEGKQAYGFAGDRLRSSRAVRTIPMDTKKLKHVDRRLTEEERARHAKIREAAVQDIPPKQGVGQAPSPPGIPARIRQAREAQGLIWYALAKLAGISNQAVIRDIEQGKDVRLSDLECVAPALGLIGLDIPCQVARLQCLTPLLQATGV